MLFVLFGASAITAALSDRQQAWAWSFAFVAVAFALCSINELSHASQNYDRYNGRK